MKNLLLVLMFSLITIGFFAGFANFGIPEIIPAPPPKEEKLDLGAMTLDKFIAVGEKLYKGKGTCTLCHNAVGGRAPLLEKVVEVSPKRLKDARYEGKAKDLQSYLEESMLDPSAFVVAGFGKVGSGDTESPMPAVTSGSIGFTEVEIGAVIAYLQDLGGAEVTVKIPSGAAKADDIKKTGDAKKAPTSAPRAALKNPEALIAKFTCGVCHKVAGQVGAIGPDLSKIGATRDKDYLRRAIMDPNADIAKGFQPMMPNIYGSQLYASELETLVDYLASLK